MNISVDLIVKNEESYLPFCVKSIQPYVDYIYITDTGSVDSTLDIINNLKNEFKKQIIFNKFSFNNNYSDVHNFVINKIKEDNLTDYYLRVDADEIYFHSVLSTLKNQLNQYPEQLTWQMPYIQFHGGHKCLDKNPYNKKPNICKLRGNEIKYIGQVHEFIYINNEHIMKYANRDLLGNFFCHYSWCYMKRRYLKKLERIRTEKAIDSYNSTLTQLEAISKFYSQFKDCPMFQVKGNYPGPYPEVIEGSWMLDDIDYSVDNSMDSECVNPKDYCEHQVIIDRWEVSCSNYNYRKKNCIK